jgi:hypothetical protein
MLTAMMRLQVYNINKNKRDAELLNVTAVNLHIVVHSFQQIPLDLAEKLLPLQPHAADQTSRQSKLVFRTDGPQALARGTPRPEEDKKLFEFVHRCRTSLLEEMSALFLCVPCMVIKIPAARRFATTATVFQSEWSLNATLSLGHHPVNPVVIGNAADPSTYHRVRRTHFERKVQACVVAGLPNSTKSWQYCGCLCLHVKHA